MSARFGGAVAVGGLASGGDGPGGHALVCGRRVMRHGAVAVVVEGGVSLRVLVSQGCAPVGPEMVITSAEGNIIHELAGRPAYERLTEIVAGLDDHGRDLVQHGLLAGLVIDENRAEYGSDDYLMRAVMGGDADQGSLVVGDAVRVGQTFRFHARDAESADADLRAALRAHAAATASGPQAALLFACNGRGPNMYADADHDAGAVADELGPIPLAGHVLLGRDRPGRRADVPARLHRDDGADRQPGLAQAGYGSGRVRGVSGSAHWMAALCRLNLVDRCPPASAVPRLDGPPDAGGIIFCDSAARRRDR